MLHYTCTASGSMISRHYPFGLAIPSQSFALPNENDTYQNRYIYNGKEYQDDFGLNWGACPAQCGNYGARFYDPQIARWHNVDPLAELGRRWSPYTHAFNNPVRFVDPDGRWPFDAKDTDSQKRRDVDKSGGFFPFKEEYDSPDPLNHRRVRGEKEEIWKYVENWPNNRSLGGKKKGNDPDDSDVIVSKSRGEILNYLSVGFSFLGSGFSALGEYHSAILYKNGYRHGINGNYLLTGRNLSMFGNKPLTLASRPASGFLTFGSKMSIVGSRLGLLSVGYATYELYRGDINEYRYLYRTSTTFVSIGAAAFLGNPAGLVVGTTAIAGEMWYDGLMKYMRELGNNIGSWHYHMKRGWNPQSINF